MDRELAGRSDRFSRRFVRVLEVLIVVSVTPALAYGILSLNNLPVV